MSLCPGSLFWLFGSFLGNVTLSAQGEEPLTSWPCPVECTGLNRTCKPLVSTPVFCDNHDPGFCNKKIMTPGWWLTSYEEVFCDHLEKRPLVETTSVQENGCRGSWEERWPSSPSHSWHVLTLFPSNIFLFSRSLNDPSRGTSVVVQWLRIHLPMWAWGWGVRKFDPWSGKMPHASGQLSPCATTEPAF